MPINALSTLSSPLSEQQVAALNPVLSTLTPFQAAWLSGYITAATAPNATAAPAGQTTQTAPSVVLTILYGSQTGNAKGLAASLEAKAQAAGLTVRLVAMDDFKAKSIKDETHLIIVTSTQGEGEPPENAIDLHKYLFSKKAPKLDNLSFGVLGLGDSSYEQFCKTGIDFSQQLSKLGAKSIIDIAECDVDYEDQAEAWSTQIINVLKADMGSAVTAAPVAGVISTAGSSAYCKQKPYTASVSVNQKITGRDSQKDIRHIEIDLEDSGLSYQPGDTLGLWFENDVELVAELLALVGLTNDEQVEVAGQALSLQQALVEHYELTQSYPSFVQAYAEASGSKELSALLKDKTELRNYCYGRQIIDVIKETPVKLSSKQLLAALRKMTPRLYSISSSQAEVDEEVHLTVAVVNYQQNDETRIGGASGFLQRLEEGDPIKVYMESNEHFRLPEDSNKPVIMVGPGTGIAPFRSFMQEREANDATGKNWLVFGAQTFTDDFLYQTEWQSQLKSGLLTRLDVAFSRDQEQKIYVQDRLREQAKELFAWLEQGAYFYICGDATRMAKDVHSALLDVVAEQGGYTQEQAEAYLEDLRKAKRYQKDVY